METVILAGAPVVARLPQVVSALGERDFGCNLIAFLNQLCGAEHCSVFQMTIDRPIEVDTGSIDGTDIALRQTRRYLHDQYWRLDPSICEALRRIGNPECGLIRQPISNISDSRFRDQVYGRADICDRVLMTGCMDGITISLSVLKSWTRGLFQDSEISLLAEFAPVLLAVLGKHARMTMRTTDFSRMLSDLHYIEAVVAMAPEGLPKREAEVCTRILFGMSTAGIALELGIGEETVMTYRKRVYERLTIGSQRELLLWYMRSLGHAHAMLPTGDRLH